jgi:hypothetical protein
MEMLVSSFSSRAVLFLTQKALRWGGACAGLRSRYAMSCRRSGVTPSSSGEIVVFHSRLLLFSGALGCPPATALIKRQALRWTAPAPGSKLPCHDAEVASLLRRIFSSLFSS